MNVSGNGLILPESATRFPQNFNMRKFYMALTEMGEGYVWLIQPSSQGDNVWLFTCEHQDMQLTHTLSDDMFTPDNARTVRDATVVAFHKGKKPDSKFKKQA